MLLFVINPYIKSLVAYLTTSSWKMSRWMLSLHNSLSLLTVVVLVFTDHVLGDTIIEAEVGLADADIGVIFSS